MPALATHRAFVVHRHRLLWGGVLAVLLLAGCGKKESQPEPGVLAKGEGWSVRADDFRHWWNTRPGPADSPQARTEALDRLVERASLAAAARKAGLESDPETVARIEAILITRLQEVQLAPQLEAVTVSEDEVRAVYDARRESAYTQPQAGRVAVQSKTVLHVVKDLLGWYEEGRQVKRQRGVLASAGLVALTLLTIPMTMFALGVYDLVVSRL
jgi:hypothetical protein